MPRCWSSLNSQETNGASHGRHCSSCRWQSEAEQQSTELEKLQEAVKRRKRTKKEGRQANRKGWTSVLWSHRILGLPKRHVAKCRPFPHVLGACACTHAHAYASVCPCVRGSQRWVPGVFLPLSTPLLCLLMSTIMPSSVDCRGPELRPSFLCRRHFTGWTAFQPHPFSISKSSQPDNLSNKEL